MAADTAYLYVMGTSDGPSKIGYSLAPSSRAKAVQRQSKAEIVLTGTWPIGARIALAIERYVHWQLRAHYIRGEWFNAPRDEILSVINKALSKKDEFDSGAVIPALDPRGKAIKYGEHLSAKYPSGTTDKINAVLDEGEARADLLREAVERELKLRERSKKR